MTERKTSEIKMRVTPSFKARVQAAAAKEDVSMSEWLEQAAEQRMRLTAAAYSSTGGMIITTPIVPFRDVVRPSGGCPTNGAPCYCTGACLAKKTPTITTTSSSEGTTEWKFVPRVPRD